MNLQDRLSRLNVATLLINEVRDSLDNSKSFCECCGLTVYENFDQVKVREMVNGILTKLEKVSERMAHQSDVFSH